MLPVLLHSALDWLYKNVKSLKYVLLIHKVGWFSLSINGFFKLLDKSRNISMEIYIHWTLIFRSTCIERNIIIRMHLYMLSDPIIWLKVCFKVYILLFCRIHIYLCYICFHSRVNIIRIVYFYQDFILITNEDKAGLWYLH